MIAQTQKLKDVAVADFDMWTSQENPPCFICAPDTLAPLSGSNLVLYYPSAWSCLYQTNVNGSTPGKGILNFVQCTHRISPLECVLSHCTPWLAVQFEFNIHGQMITLNMRGNRESNRVWKGRISFTTCLGDQSSVGQSSRWWEWTLMGC